MTDGRPVVGHIGDPIETAAARLGPERAAELMEIGEDTAVEDLVALVLATSEPSPAPALAAVPAEAAVQDVGAISG